MKTKIIICFLIVVLTSGCNLRQKENNDYVEKGIESVGDNGNKPERIFIELTYIESLDNVLYRMTNILTALSRQDEFTWWNHYTIGNNCIVDYTDHLSEYYNFVLPDDIDMTKHDLIISFGRKLKYLYYYEDDYTVNAAYKKEDGYRARPIFEEEYIHLSAHVYLVDKVHLVNSELATYVNDDMRRFMNGEIPFELPEED